MFTPWDRHNRGYRTARSSARRRGDVRRFPHRRVPWGFAVPFHAASPPRMCRASKLRSLNVVATLQLTSALTLRGQLRHQSLDMRHDPLTRGAVAVADRGNLPLINPLPLGRDDVTAEAHHACCVFEVV